jgi:hypothetical protein
MYSYKGVRILQEGHFAPVDLNAHRKVEAYTNYNPQTSALKENTGIGRKFVTFREF